MNILAILRSHKITLTLSILILVISTLAFSFYGIDNDASKIREYFGFCPCLTSANNFVPGTVFQKWWGTVTYAFVHADFYSHLLPNLAVLLLFGWVIEERIGDKWFVLLITFSSLITQLVTILISQNSVTCSGPCGGIGASAIDFSLAGFIIFFVISRGINHLRAHILPKLSISNLFVLIAFTLAILEPTCKLLLVGIDEHFYALIIGLILAYIMFNLRTELFHKLHLQNVE